MLHQGRGGGIHAHSERTSCSKSERQPEAVYLLVNDADLNYNSQVQTVRKNYKGFTKKQIQQATKACRKMGMIGAPTECEYQALVSLDLLKDCPITNTDIVNAHKIFGPDFANIRGKMVRRKPEHVNTDILEILHQILSDVCE